MGPLYVSRGYPLSFSSAGTVFNHDLGDSYLYSCHIKEFHVFMWSSFTSLCFHQYEFHITLPLSPLLPISEPPFSLYRCITFTPIFLVRMIFNHMGSSIQGPNKLRIKTLEIRKFANQHAIRNKVYVPQTLIFVQSMSSQRVKTF